VGKVSAAGGGFAVFLVPPQHRLQQIRALNAVEGKRKVFI
jgi:galactokinase/mevalonate kinase-like predicted kinase